MLSWLHEVGIRTVLTQVLCNLLIDISARSISTLFFSHRTFFKSEKYTRLVPSTYRTACFPIIVASRRIVVHVEAILFQFFPSFLITLADKWRWRVYVVIVTPHNRDLIDNEATRRNAPRRSSLKLQVYPLSARTIITHPSASLLLNFHKFLTRLPSWFIPRVGEGGIREMRKRKIRTGVR